MIVFQKLRWRNFISTGNYFNEIDFLRHNTTLVCGENGAGKSTMLDALTYVLFGKSFRGINIPQLVNGINDKQSVVEIEFIIGEHEYLVRRGQKPKVFEIFKDGSLIDQDSTSKDYQRVLEEQILKMSYKSFCQIVILGSSNYIPFMKLPAADRRAVVETLLDIDVFSSMNQILKYRNGSIKDTIRETEYQIELLKTKMVEKEKHIQDIESRSKTSHDLHTKEIKETKKSIEEYEQQREKLEDQRQELLNEISDLSKINETLSDLQTHSRYTKKEISDLEKQIDFYDKNSTCPTCNQKVNNRDELVGVRQEKKAELESEHESILNQIDETKESLAKIENTLNESRKIGDIISDINSSISSATKYLDKIHTDIERIEEEKIEFEVEKQNLKNLAEQGKDLVLSRLELIRKKNTCEEAALLLSDTGIKARIIKHYLPIINKLINHYLTAMDFFCLFILDERFHETIKSRHREEFSYQNFSEGERLRIDLSLLFAWREVARLRNSTNCNLLILDEVLDSSLDNAGTEEFLKILRGLDKRMNIFIISHKADQLMDKFDGTLNFKKRNNFSVMS